MISALHNFFRGKPVLLTGHTGFKGSWLALWLAHCGAEVHGYSLAPATQPSLFEEAQVAGVLASHTIGDVTDAEALSKAVRASQPAIVFHLAAQPLVRRSYRDPIETFQTNVMGTAHLLEALRTCPSVRVCQVITTDKVYENREWAYSYRESDRLGGHDPYSTSKACAELVVASYRKSFFQPSERPVAIATARAGNVIGGGDFAEDRIVPDCIRALGRGQSIVVRNPGAIRPWQHVLEPLSGYLLLACRQWQCPEVCDAFNFGPLPEAHISVQQVVEDVVAAWGSGTWHTPANLPAVHEAGRLSLDISKATALLGWSPRYRVREAIGRTVDWYARWMRREADARSLCMEQIRHYELAAAAKAGQSEDGAHLGPEPLTTT